jgi:hypothetical protein
MSGGSGAHAESKVKALVEQTPRGVRLLAVATTVAACVRIAQRYADRSPYAWMVVFIDAATILTVVVLACPGIVGSFRRWRTNTGLAAWATLSLAALVPAVAIAVRGWI